MAINTTVGNPAPGSDPAVIAGRITLEISNPDTNTILAVGVGLSASAAVSSIQQTSNSRQRLVAELDPRLRDARNALADLTVGTGGEALFQRRKASLETEIAGYEKRIADANSDISAAAEALAYINSGEYQAAIDQRVLEATEPAPKDVAIPDSPAGQAGNSENPPPAVAVTTPSTGGTSATDTGANQESNNEQAAYAAAQKQAADTNSADKEAIASGNKSPTADPSAARLDAAGVAAGAKPPSKNPAAPAVSVGGVKKEDLRVRIALAPQSPNIFYKDTKNDLLKPLKETDGVIFPIQPTISIGHEARYQGTDLTHSNFTFWNYQNSAVKPISLTGEFLIRNPREGRYCIAAIRFLQAMTKMFNANDTANNMKGAPPAVARLYGLGLMGFDSMPVVITSVDVNYGADVDLLSLAVAVNGTTEVTKLPASFQITVTMNPIFSREFATNFFGTQDYASGKVRLLGKSVITPIVTTAPAATPSAAANGNSNVAVTGNSATNTNMAKPDSAAGTAGNNAGNVNGVTTAVTGSGTDSKTEVSKEKTTTRNADGSTTETTTETVNGVKKVTTTTVDATGKSTTTVDGGASGTGAGTASTSANAAGNGGDNTQPKDEDAAASAAEKLRQLEADFRSKGEAIERQIELQMGRLRTAIEQTAPLALANLEKNIATEQADLAVMETIVARAAGGAAFPMEGYPNLEAVKRDMEVARSTIAGFQTRIASGFPYGFSESTLNSFATSSSEYVSAKAKLQAEVSNLQKLSGQSYDAGIGSKGGTSFLYSSISASYFVDPPEVKINGRTI